MQKKLGYFLLALSFTPWLAVVVLPFFDFSSGEILAYSASFYILGQIAFAAGLLLLGKDAWRKISSKLSIWRKK